MDDRSEPARDRQDGAEPVYGPAYRQGEARQPQATEVTEPVYLPLNDEDEAYGLPLAPATAGAMAYLLAPAVYFLLAPPYRFVPSIRFHSWQAIFYFLLVVGIREVEEMLLSMLPSTLAYLLSGLVLLVLFAGWLIAFIKALQGERFHLPLVGGFAEQVARTSSTQS